MREPKNQFWIPPEVRKEVRRLDVYDLETYLEFKLKENPDVFTHSPPAESFLRPAPFSDSLQKELDRRDLAMNKNRHSRIYEESYQFDPDKFLVDRKIPKGGILQALRDSCKE